MTDRTLKDIGEEMLANRDIRRALAQKDKDLKQQYEALEQEALALLDAQGVSLMRTAGATFSVSETVVPAVKDWDAFYGYIAANDAFHLLQRRPASTAWRELHERGETVPGTEPFTERSVNVRAL